MKNLYRILGVTLAIFALSFIYVTNINAKSHVQSINIQDNGGHTFKANYTYKKYKGYNREIADKEDISNTSNHQLFLKGITYYKLNGSHGLHTAVSLNLLMKNNAQADFNQNIAFFDTYHANYLSNAKNDKLNLAWKRNSHFNSIGISGEQPGTVTFVTRKKLSLNNLKNMKLNYWVNVNQISGHHYSANIKY